MATERFSEETIKKAEELLGLVNEDNNDDVEKGGNPTNSSTPLSTEQMSESNMENNNEPDKYVYKAVEAIKANVAKGMDVEKAFEKAKKDMDYDEETMKKAYNLYTENLSEKDTENNNEPDKYKYKGEVSKAKKGEGMEDEEGEEEEEDDEKKEKGSKTMKKSEIDIEIEKAEKALEDLKAKKEGEQDIKKSDFDKIEDLIKSQSEDSKELIKSVGVLSKSAMDSVGELSEKFNEFEERLGKIESQPNGRKSVITKSFIENKEEGAGGKTTLSLSNMDHRNKISNMLDGISKGEDDENILKAQASLELKEVNHARDPEVRKAINRLSQINKDLEIVQ